MTDDEMEIVRGSGNIYADLGHPDADAKLMKAELAADIIATLDRRKLTAREGEALTGITAADLSRIRNADLGRFTIDRLIRVANALGRRATIRITSAKTTMKSQPDDNGHGIAAE